MNRFLTTPAPLIAIRGAGDLATGVALRLARCGFRIILSELPQPLCIRRTVAFATAVYEGSTTVEEICARRIETINAAEAIWQAGELPLIIDPDLRQVLTLKPDVLVDARIMKSYRNDTDQSMANCVIGLGPGFIAGENAHLIVETNRGHNLGRVIRTGSAEPNTGVPGLIRGEGAARVVKAPCDGVFAPVVTIGQSVQRGELLARIVADGSGTTLADLPSPLEGIVRGVLTPGLPVREGLKIMDVDPRGNPAHCFTVSDKALSIAGGVLEAILSSG